MYFICGAAECGLKQADLQFNWQHATNLAEYHDISVTIDLVLYDANFDGLTLDKAITFFSASNPQIPVLVINGESKIPAAVAAIKAGAVDYLTSEALSELPRAIVKALSESNSPQLLQRETQSDRQLQRLIIENPDGIIVVDERGIVTASSQGLGKGATFTISLPVLDRPIKTATQQASQQGNNLLGSKVLVVDDNDDSRNLICFILEAEGAEVNTAQSAVEALSEIEQFQPHILISDIGMPQMNGYELIQKIRQLQPNAVGNVKAIAISGYASEQDRQRSLTAGFDHHLNKPIDISSLIKAIED